VIDVLLDTARDMDVDATAGFTCHDDTGTPVIDAFDAILAAGSADVRRAILDVTGSGAFTEHDLARILQEFDARDGALDYSRYDLNGSGHTGGMGEERFDLDMSGSYGTVTQTAEGVTLTFDETRVTDIDVLCYYAFDDLYTGDEALRFELLASPCGILPSFFFPPIGTVIRTFDPGSLEIGGERYDTLPRLELWSPTPLNDVLDYYLEVEGLDDWGYVESRTQETPLHYLLEQELESGFVDLLEEWSLITPSIMIRRALPDDGLPEGALTFVRVAYDELSLR